MSDINKISRKEAAERLKVSIRTVDRHIKSGKLKTYEENGRKWLSIDDLVNFFHENQGRHNIDNVDNNMSTKNNMDKVDNSDTFSQEDLSPLSTSKRKTPSSTYKKLYEQTKEELNEKQERLEIANYRVGQLEAQLRNSIPLLKYHQENSEIQNKIEEFENKMKEKNILIQKFSHKVKQEKITKRIFLVIILIIMALQPLWLLTIE